MEVTPNLLTDQPSEQTTDSDYSAEEFRATILELEETVTNVNEEKATLVEKLASLRRKTDDIIADREEDVANVKTEKATLVEQLASLRAEKDAIIADREAA